MTSDLHLRLIRDCEDNLATMEVRQFTVSDLLRCPFAIMVFEHYRDDGTCKCNDKHHRDTVMIPRWEYTEQDFTDAGVQLD